jgi:hypothetical protein
MESAVTELPFTEDDVQRYARAFHEAHERLAPSFGYKTRDRSAVPWDEVPDDNKGLMLATVRAVLAVLADGGRLLPGSGDRKVYWGLDHRGGIEPVGAGTGSEILARTAAASGDGVLVRQVRTVWPDGEIHWGSWTPVTDEAALTSESLAEAGRRVLSDEDRDAIAEEAEAKRRGDV